MVLNSCRLTSSREDEDVNICVTVLQHHPSSEEHSLAQEVSTGCGETLSLQEVAPTNTGRDDSQNMMDARVQTEADICGISIGATGDRCEVGTQTLEVEDSSAQTKSSSFATVQTTAPVLLATTPVTGNISNRSHDSSVRLVESNDSNYVERDDCTAIGGPMTTAVYINTPSGMDVASKQWEMTENVSSVEEQLSEEVEIAAVLLNTVEWDEGGKYGNWRSPQLQE